MRNIIHIKSRRSLILVNQPIGIIHAIHITPIQRRRPNLVLVIPIGLLLVMVLAVVRRPAYAGAWAEPAP